MPKSKQSRTYLLLLAVLGTLAAPFFLTRVLGQGLAPPQAALSQGSAIPRFGQVPLLRIITPHNQEIQRVFESAFSAWYLQHYGEPVQIQYLAPGGSRDIVRYLKELFDSYRNGQGKLPPEDQMQTGIDLVWGGGDYVFERDYKPLLKPLKLSPGLLSAAFPHTHLAGVPLLDLSGDGDQPRWVGVVLSSFGIVYSPEFYETLQLEAPRRWQDLALPQLNGLVALADPTRSGPASLIYMMVIQRAMADAQGKFLAEHPAIKHASEAELEGELGYAQSLAQGWKRGMRTLLKLAANARYFTDSSRRLCADVADSQAAVGVSIDFYARVFQEEIGRHRLRYVAPSGQTAITPDPIGVLYGTTGSREVLANRWVEFLLTEQGQNLWNLQSGQPHVVRSLRRLPIVRAVYASREHWADRNDNPFEQVQGFNLRQRWMSQMSVLRPIWAAAWIDTEVSLKRVYREILTLPVGKERERLLFELSDLPIEMDDLKSPAPPGAPRVTDQRLAVALNRAAWARRFRAHYQSLLRRVRGRRP